MIGDQIEARGVKGGRKWRRLFDSADAVDAYAARTGSTVLGTRVMPARFALVVGSTIRLRSHIGDATARFMFDGQAAGATAIVEAIRPDAHGNPFWATLRFADGSTGGTDRADVVDVHGAYCDWERL